LLTTNVPAPAEQINQRGVIHVKQVIIGMKNGKPFVVSAPKKIEVIFKEEKRRSVRKIFKTWVYRLKTLGR
jgi:hypothetical protein